MKLTKVSYHVLVYKGFLWLLNSMAIFAMVVDITRREIQIPNFLTPTISDYHYSFVQLSRYIAAFSTVVLSGYQNVKWLFVTWRMKVS